MRTLFILIGIVVCLSGYSQSVTQTIKGNVSEKISHEPLPFASIVIQDIEQAIGTTSDVNGDFLLENVPVGRRNIQISMLGYETFNVRNLLITSGKEVVLNIELQQQNTKLKEVVVSINKDETLNTMTTLSSRQFSVEETQRYAGGLNDPARLASSFAGVATTAVSSNGISVRGNNPNGLLWRIEGVEVPNPNHFANLTVVGGGLLTAISNQMMGNSDFYTGGFPAEYGNALSGVFDIKLKTGNYSKRQYTFQAGVLGIDLASQGPFKKGKPSSYNINYRYSTMGLLSPLLPDDTGVLKYQDLSFKTNFLTQNTGTFSLWGIAALDLQQMNAADSIHWESYSDRDNSKTAPYMFAIGLNHKIVVNQRSFLNSSLSFSGSGLSHKEHRLDYNLVEHPQTKIQDDAWRITFQSNLNKHFSDIHTNRTGFVYNYMGYFIDIKESDSEQTIMESTAKQQGNTCMLQFFSQSKIDITPKLKANLGVNLQYFLLNEHYSIEPRIGLIYTIDDKHRLAFTYGKYSRIEQLPVYFVVNDGGYPNKNLDFMKSAHYILSYNWKPTDNLRISIEPYFQYLTNVPVSPDSYVSTLNIENDMFFSNALVNKGKGRNVGIDFTLERYLDKGYYWLFTGSVFDSKYIAVDGIERNTRFNKNYVFNVLAGKEWTLGKEKNNLLGINIRLNYLGGNRAESIDKDASIQSHEIVFGETNNQLAFEEKYKDIPVFSFTIQYRKNKPKYSSIWSLQVLNANGAEDFSNYYYNLKTHKIQAEYEGVMIPNLSYKIEF